MRPSAIQRRDAAILAAAKVPLDIVATANGFKLKQVGGFWINSADNHILRFLLHLHSYWQGRATYQAKQLWGCLKVIPKARRRLALDVGAHIGTWSRVLCQEFQKVIGFEAFQVHVECLRLNVPNNNFSVVNGIVTDHDGAMDFLELWNKPGMSRVCPPGVKGLSTPARKLDTILQANDIPVDFIKVDVEGQELQVMRGAEQTLRRWKPYVIMEQKDLSKDYEPGKSRWAASEFVASLGAKVITRIGDDIIMGW